MTIAARNILQSVLNVLWTKPYESFFGILALLIIAPFITMLGALLMADPIISPFWNLVIVYLILLAVLAVFLNVDGQETSAKQLFWFWILFSTGLTVLAGFGYLEVLFFRWMLLE